MTLKRLVRAAPVIALALTLGTVAMANIIPTLSTVTPVDAIFMWSYDLQLSADQNINNGPFPLVTPVLTGTTTAGFLTLYDFQGYVPGSCAAPTGWTCSAQLVGFTPSNVSPIDSLSITNITWAYSGGTSPIVGSGASGGTAGTDLGAFTPRLCTQTGGSPRVKR